MSEQSRYPDRDRSLLDVRGATSRYSAGAVRTGRLIPSTGSDGGNAPGHAGHPQYKNLRLRRADRVLRWTSTTGALPPPAT